MWHLEDSVQMPGMRNGIKRVTKLKVYKVVVMPTCLPRQYTNVMQSKDT